MTTIIQILKGADLMLAWIQVAVGFILIGILIDEALSFVFDRSGRRTGKRKTVGEMEAEREVAKLKGIE